MKKITKLSLLLATLLSLSACDIGVSEGENTTPNTEDNDNHDQDQGGNQDQGGDQEGSGTEETKKKGTVALPESIVGGSITADKKSGNVDDLITLTLTINEGYELVSITVGGKAPTKISDTKYTFKLAEGSNQVLVTLKEKIIVNTITIDDYKGKHGRVFPKTLAGVKGEKVELISTAEPGYELDYIKFNDKAVEADADGKYFITIVDGANKVTYNYKLINVLVDAHVFKNDNGKVEILGDKTGRVGTDFKVKVTPTAGYELDKLFFNDTDITATVKGDEATITRVDYSNTVYATFKKIAGAATVVKTDNIVFTPSETGYKVGDTITVEAAVKAENHVTSITHNGKAVRLNPNGTATITLVNGKNTIDATYAADTTLSGVSIGEIQNGLININTIKANVGDKVSFTVEPNKGYSLTKDSVVYNGNKVDPNDKGVYEIEIVAGNKELTCAFEDAKTKSSITFNESELGITKSLTDLSNIVAGDSITVLVSPKTGNEVQSVTYGGSTIACDPTGGILTFKAIAGAEELSVTYRSTTASSLKLADNIENGTINLLAYDPYQLRAGSQVTIEAIPAKDYRLVSATHNGKAITFNKYSVAFITLEAGENIFDATFEAIPKKSVQIVETDGGTFTVSDENVNSGTEVTITAKPNAGYFLEEARFDGQLIEFDENNEAKVKLTDGDNKLEGKFMQEQVSTDKNIIISGSVVNNNLLKFADKSDDSDFKDKTSVYKVGDDNDFFFKPEISTINRTNPTKSLIKNNKKWPLVVELEKKTNDTYSKVALDDYATVDNVKGTIKFKEIESVTNNLYKLTYYPQGFTKEEAAEKTALHTLELQVLDGYNVFDESELAYINNQDQTLEQQSGFPKYHNTKTIWDEFKTNHGLDTNKLPNGLYIHKDLKITPNEMPKEYFYTREEVGDNYNKLGKLKDYTCMFKRTLNKKHEKFDMDGNYFKLDFSEIPYTPIELRKQEFSHANLFFFNSPKETFEGDVVTTETTLRNFRTVGNAPKQDKEYCAGGLIMNKAEDTNFTIQNNVSVSLFISYYSECSKGTYKIKQCNASDSYNCFVYNWGGNVEIIDSKMTSAGGPIIIQDHVGAKWIGGKDEASHRISKSTTSVDAKSELISEVTGLEGWFVTVNADALVPQIKALDALLNGAFNSSFLTQKEDNTYFNVLVVNKSDEAQATTANPKVGGTIILPNGLQDNAPATFNYFEGNPALRGFYETVSGMGAPIFQTSAGGICWSDGEHIFAPQFIIIPDVANIPVSIGDYAQATQQGGKDGAIACIQTTIETMTKKAIEGDDAKALATIFVNDNHDIMMANYAALCAGSSITLYQMGMAFTLSYHRLAAPEA